MDAYFRYLNKPEPPKRVDDISHWLVSWENRIAMMHAMDSRYIITDQSRRNVVYDSMPADIQKIFDTEMSKGNLPDWKAMKDFLTNYSDSDAVSRSMKPPPILQTTWLMIPLSMSPNTLTMNG